MPVWYQAGYESKCLKDTAGTQQWEIRRRRGGREAGMRGAGGGKVGARDRSMGVNVRQRRDCFLQGGVAARIRGTLGS